MPQRKDRTGSVVTFTPLKRKASSGSRRVNINFSPEEAALLDRLAAEANCTRASLIRGAVRVIQIGVEAESVGKQLAVVDKQTKKVVAKIDLESQH